jgi:cytochrome P450
VISLMMGVPDEMMGEVVRWSDAMAEGGPAYQTDQGAARAAAARREAAKAALADYLGELLARRRAQPGDDLVSTLATAEVAGGYTDAQLVQNLRQLLFAGNETTARWLGHIFAVYGERPDLQREVSADRSLIVPVNDEIMRWQGVVGTLIRRVRGGPVALGGVSLADGDDVTLLLSSANRDPERFDEPDQFDIARRPEANLGFGVGLHHCLGINLAKLEAEVLVGAVLDQIKAFRLAAPYQYSALPMRGPNPIVIALYEAA